VVAYPRSPRETATRRQSTAATRHAAAASGRRFIGSRHRSLASEQGSLALPPPAIAAQITITADHPVAWHDQRQLVRGTGLSARAHRLRLAEYGGDLAVARGLAQRDLLQCT